MRSRSDIEGAFHRARSNIASTSSWLRFVLVSICLLFPVSAKAEAPTQDVRTVGFSIVVVMIAAVAAYVFNSRIEKKRSQLKFVSDQLQFLYGPLYSLNSASEQAWTTFRRGCRPTGSFFNKYDPASRQEIEEWRHWMTTVFMPINKRIEDVIIDNVHLVEGATIPESFLSVLAHVASYRAVVEKWPTLPILDDADFAVVTAQHTAAINFPSDFQDDVGKGFRKLKARQTKLAASFGR